MTRQSRVTKASYRGAFLVYAALAFPLLLATRLSWADTTGCEPDRIDEWAIVEYVYDGDTVRLVDGRRVRLIGINAPEIGRDGAPSDPFAQRARQALMELAGPKTRVGLRYDETRTDKYRRSLAHLFLGNGTSLQEELLDQGLATTLVVPPNVWSLDCYADAEARALRTRRALWSLPQYQIVEAEQLGLDTRGFRIITGRVQRVGHSKSSVWLNLSPQVALRIPRDDLSYFADFDPVQLNGRRVIARGWLYLRRDQLRMTIRHSANLKQMD